MLATTLAIACEKETERSAEGPPEQPKPAQAAAPTDDEKLRALGPNAAAEEVGLICIQLRKANSADSIPADLRQRCARAMLRLSEVADPTTVTSKRADEWIDLARQFGASPAAIAKAEKSLAKRVSRRLQTDSRNSTIEGEAYANSEDARQAKEFLSSLPAACNRSRASASRDGTVTIRLSCEGANKALSGQIKIKNGVVTEVQ